MRKWIKSYAIGNKIFDLYKIGRDEYRISQGSGRRALCKGSLAECLDFIGQKKQKEEKVGFERELEEPKTLDMSLSPEERKKIIEDHIEKMFKEAVQEWKKNHPGMETKKKNLLPEWQRSIFLQAWKRYLRKCFMDKYPGLAKDKETLQVCISKKAKELLSE